MRAGALDQRVTIEARSSTQDEYGAPIVGWVIFAHVWAEVREIHSSERVIEQVRTMSRIISITLRYVPGVTSDMRVRLADGRYLQIRSLAVIGKKTGWSMLCDEYSN